MVERNGPDQGELREALELSQAALSWRAGLLAAMGHELRTPLNAIIGFAELLEDGGAGQLNDRQRRYVANILESGRGLLSVMDQVLEVARAGAAGAPAAATPAGVDLADAVRDVLVLLRPLAARREVRLNVALDPALPRARAEAPVVKQVVYGLAANAIARAETGGDVAIGGVALEAGSDGRPLWVELNVSPAHGGDGPAMSLALARRLVEQQGGRLWLEGEGQARGATARFVLPRPPANGRHRGAAA